MKRHRKKKGFTHHLASPGFGNRFTIYILLFLAAGLAGNFYLANESIRTGCTDAPMCWTVVFTLVGTICSIMLSRIVHKSKTESAGGDGDGIRLAMTTSDVVDDDGSSWESPAI